MKKATLAFGILFSFAIFFGSAKLNAQTKTAKQDSTISWNKSKHVFGSIEHKQAVTAEFTFKNNGKMPIAISKVGTTCGCTTPAYTKEPIKVGEEGTIKLRFDGKTPGFFKKAAKVHFTNGTEKEIEIEGKVVIRKSDVK